MSKWMLRQAAVDITALAQKWHVHPVIAHILAVRGFRETQDVKAFIDAEQQKLADPLLFADLPHALELIVQAIEQKQRIAIFGDYDVDGITSTVILFKTLQALGADVIYYIPERENEGYGLNNEAIYHIRQELQAKILLTCDNGISAFEQILYAKDIGLTTIVLDHHDIPLDQAGQPLLVAADAVVDSKRPDCCYPFKLYCAAALCYRFAEALYFRLEQNWQPLQKQLLPFAALATVCDLVDLVGENRTIVKQGLPLVSQSQNPGLIALREATGLLNTELNAYHLGFRLGPCINASGRLEAASLAVELFLTEDAQQAKEQATYLVALNEARKSLTEQGTEIVRQTIAQEGRERDKIIVIHCPTVQESVAGIIAGRIKEQYHHPTIVTAGTEEQIRGSCRSIQQYNIFEGLSACKELFTSFGGHPMAAGFGMPLANLDLLRERLNQACTLTEDDFQAQYRIDKRLPLEKANLELARELAVFEPIGKGNPSVLFADKAVRLIKVTLIGQNKNVMRLLIQGSSGQMTEAISFEGKDTLAELVCQTWNASVWDNLLTGTNREQVIIDVLYTLSVNAYQGQENVQIQIKQFRSCGNAK